MNIIESISNNGVKTTPKELLHIRLCRPRSGDIIDFGENEGNYPFIYGRYGRIADGEGQGFARKGEVHTCCELGSAFLLDGGRVDISGGPFELIKTEELEPAMRTYRAPYWNWGDRGRGAGHGVYYHIDRPLFKMKKRPDKK